LAKVFWFFFSKKNVLASINQDQGGPVLNDRPKPDQHSIGDGSVIQMQRGKFEFPRCAIARGALRCGAMCRVDPGAWLCHQAQG
jgi:hypothetical protein